MVGWVTRRPLLAGREAPGAMGTEPCPSAESEAIGAKDRPGAAGMGGREGGAGGFVGGGWGSLVLQCTGFSLRGLLLLMSQDFSSCGN